MINIVSSDSICRGKASAIGIRARQLYKLFSNHEVNLLVPDINYSPPYKSMSVFPYFFKDNLDYKYSNPDRDLYILPLNSFNKVNNLKNIIVDGFSPILVEEYFLNLSDEERGIRRLLIRLMLNKCKALIYATPYQKLYYIGLLNSYNIKKPLIYIPLYLPLVENKRFIRKKNGIILIYGGVYPWMDLKRMISFFRILPKNYKFLFKGVKHPRYKRDKGLEILKKELSYFPKLKNRVIIDTSWNDEILEIEGSIFLGKEPESSVACRTRALDLMSQGIPMILDEEEHAYEIGRRYNLAISSKNSIKELLILLDKKVNSKGLKRDFSFNKIQKLIQKNNFFF